MAVAFLRAAEAFFPDCGEHGLCEYILLDEEIQVCTDNADLFHEVRDRDGVMQLLRDHRRSLTECLRQTEAGKCIVAHFGIRRDLDQLADLRLGERGELSCQKLNDLFFHI